MARAMTCIYNGKEVSIDEAIEIRENSGNKNSNSLNFKCKECGEQVRPHKAGGNSSAHFEHLMRNARCQLSDPAR